MTQKEFKNLEKGDVIQRVDSTQSYVVVENDGWGKVIIQSTKEAENPMEWNLVSKKK